jgi:photosystem II stability/assembly factor-like uncharacterized protein
MAVLEDWIPRTGIPGEKARTSRHIVAGMARSKALKPTTILLSSVLTVRSIGSGEPVPPPQWHRLPTEAYPKKRDDIVFADVHTGFYGTFAGTSGDLGQSNALILKTTDASRTWHQVYRSSRLNQITWKASFASHQVSYATAQNDNPKNLKQCIVKTTDGGAHLFELPLVVSEGAEELEIGFISPQKGWVGLNVGSFETVNGGKTWEPSTLARKANKIRTRSADGTSMVYAMGTEVQVYR